MLAGNAQLPVKNVRQLVAWAKANPGKLNYASVGNGSSSHLNMEMLKSVAGFDAVHVPFNGSPPAVTLFKREVPERAMAPTMVLPVGGSQPHENRMPYLTITYIIALQGIFPSRN